jgi:hypothetical protein
LKAHGLHPSPPAMLDLFYIVLALLFFALCWFFTKACDRL